MKAFRLGRDAIVDGGRSEFQADPLPAARLGSFWNEGIYGPKMRLRG